MITMILIELRPLLLCAFALGFSPSTGQTKTGDRRGFDVLAAAASVQRGSLRFRSGFWVRFRVWDQRLRFVSLSLRLGLSRC